MIPQPYAGILILLALGLVVWICWVIAGKWEQRIDRDSRDWVDYTGRPAPWGDRWDDPATGYRLGDARRTTKKHRKSDR